jgi:tetratricopeptide (TPR) repeat protein
METVLEQYCEVGHEWYPPVYAWALLDVGDEERAAEVLSAARQRAMESTTRAELPDVLLQCARLAARQGRWEDAAHDLEEGLGITQEIGLPYDQALLLCEYGQMHATKGEPELARDRLGQALTIFQRLGAVPDVERAEHLLAELGAE